MGKTRLVTEFLSGKRKHALVLSARGYPFGSSTPFGLWAEALDGHLRGLRPDVVQALCGGSVFDLAGILRSVAVPQRAQRATTTPVQKPVEGMAVLLTNLSRTSSIIVHLDDVHLADPSSWEALDYLAHNLADAPVLIVLCARHGELAGQWAPKQALHRLEQEDILKRIALPPLDVEEIRQLIEALQVAPAAPEVLVGWLWERSRGTPLFVLGLIDALVAQGVDLSAPELASVPAALSERVLASVSRLDAASRAVLETLAVIGRGAEMPELTPHAPGSREKLDAALATLLEAGLIEADEDAAGVRYRIVHPLVQDAIFQNIVTPRRRVLHRVVARNLLASGRLGEAAPHLVRSAEPADAEAIDALAGAVRQAWRANAFAEAFEIMSALFELVPTGDDRWLDVLDLMSLEGEWTFHHKTDIDYELCIRVLRKAERLMQATADQGRLATLNLHLASFLAWGHGDLAESEHRGNAAVGFFRAAGDDARARLALNELAWIRGVEGDLSAQEHAARAVLSAAEAADDRGAVLLALANIASTAWPRGRFAEAEVLYRRCIEIAASDGNGSRLRHGRTLLAMTLALDGRLGEARASLAAAEAADPQSSDALILEFGPHITWFTGDVRATLASARSSIARVGPRRLTLVSMIGALAATEAGETAAARSFLAGAAETVAERRRWIIGSYHRWASGVFASRAGNATGALDELERASSRLLDMEALPVAAMVLVDLVDVAVHRDLDAAERALRSLHEIAERLGRDHYRALATMGAAEVELVMGSSESAAARAQDAQRLLADRGYSLLEGRALDAVGRALTPFDRSGAIRAFEGAAALFNECGAIWRRDRSLEQLRTLGSTGRRVAAVIRHDALTRRERQVSELAMQGLSARDIGRRLFIGERTVETHLANVYAKLGVRTRLELMQRQARVQR